MEKKKCGNGVCKISEEEKLKALELKEKADSLPDEKIQIFLFGKENCPLCQKTKGVLSRINRDILQVTDRYFDLDTLEGLSKAAYYNAFGIPVVILFKNGKEIKRWKEEVPDLSLVEKFLYG